MGGPPLQDAEGWYADQHVPPGGRARGGPLGRAEGEAGLLLPLRRRAEERRGGEEGDGRQVHEARDLHEEEDGRTDARGEQQRGRCRRKPDRQLLREGRREVPGEGGRLLG